MTTAAGTREADVEDECFSLFLVFFLSYLIQVDTSVDRSFGLVALEEGLHGLLTHAHVGEVLAQFLRRRRTTVMSSEGDEAALMMDRRGRLTGSRL